MTAHDVKKVKKMKRTVYLSDATWQLLTFDAIINDRTISDQLEFIIKERLKKKSPPETPPQSEKVEPLHSVPQAGLLSGL